MEDAFKSATSDVFEYTFGDVISQARKRKGISRVALARKIGVSPNTMIRYEKAGQEDGQFPTLQAMVRIAYLLDLDPSKIFDEVHALESLPEDDADGFSFYYEYSFDEEKEYEEAFADPRFQKVIKLLRELGVEIGQDLMWGERFRHSNEKNSEFIELFKTLSPETYTSVRSAYEEKQLLRRKDQRNHEKDDEVKVS